MYSVRFLIQIVATLAFASFAISTKASLSRPQENYYSIVLSSDGVAGEEVRLTAEQLV